MASWFSSSKATPDKKKSDANKQQLNGSTDTNVLFTANRCPPGPGLECSAELPYGLVWTPLSESEEKVPKIQSPTDPSQLPSGALCMTCLAYLNPHCTIDKDEWKCSLCGETNVVPCLLYTSPSPRD